MINRHAVMVHAYSTHYTNQHGLALLGGNMEWKQYVSVSVE